jgi:hypothetical protein
LLEDLALAGCVAWVKHKLHREEHLAMTGVRRTSGAVAKAVFVARALPDGLLIGESTGRAVRGVGTDRPIHGTKRVRQEV